MFPLIDLAFKKKAKPAPTPTPIETRQHDDLTAPAWLSGQPWLAMRSDYLRPDAMPHPPLAAEGMAQDALARSQLEHITPFIIREGAQGAHLKSEDPFTDPKDKEPAPSRAA
jgi:hypothetical protein